MKERKHHIGSRIFLQQLALLAAVSACIFLAFNLFFIHYINADVRNQLDTISAAMNDYVTEGRGSTGVRTGSDGAPLPNLTHILKNQIRTEAEIFNMDDAYTVTDYDKSDDGTELSAVASSLRKAAVNLDGAKYVHVKTASGEYYVSSIADPVLDGRYMVFAVNVTGARALGRVINTALAVIMAAAMLISLAVSAAITRTVTEPVKALSAFAEDIGRGDFQRRDLKFRDTEFCELADSMNKSAEKLDEFDKDQRNFFQNVSHELRTPLMSIRCYSEGICCGVMDPVKSGAVIISETDRLSRMVEDLLYLSRMDRESAPEKTQTNDLRETAAVCADELAALAKQNGIRIDYDFDEQPVLFTYNENQISRAISNLLANALRYAAAQVTLSCHAGESGIQISVTDDGPGVTAYPGPGGRFELHFPQNTPAS